MAKKGSTNRYPAFAPKNVVITIIILAVLLTSALFIAAYNQPQNSTSSQTHAAYNYPTPAYCPRGYIRVCKPYIGCFCVRR